jgi:hypothetical protein
VASGALNPALAASNLALAASNPVPAAWIPARPFGAASHPGTLASAAASWAWEAPHPPVPVPLAELVLPGRDWKLAGPSVSAPFGAESVPLGSGSGARFTNC